ncbi:saccharopine dehydrogenase NADP-binding domain-containing protein [Rouxiella sp. T17]|uniref:NAD-dependent epimerase/dehydratase family protein n=1 Tax=Rouxiella sp. T17 TaxID=3085684 RepID=UPI002FC79C90
MVECRKTVGVLGATGSVGKHVVRFLAPYADILAASRRPTRGDQEGIKACQLDLLDNLALREFLKSCDLVVNCAAPGSLTEERVARLACELGIDYVDPGGDEPLYAALASRTVAQQSAILSAGMLPGLSGVLPRLLAEEFTQLTALTGYALNHEPFSTGGAKDFLASLDNGFSMAGLSLQRGELQPCASPSECQLPLASIAAQAVPFLSSEWQRMSRQQRLGEVAWFNLYPHGELYNWLGTLREKSPRKGVHTTPAQRVEQLVALSLADFASKPTQHVIAVEASGWRDGKMSTRSIVLSARQGAELTAAVTAFTAIQLLNGKLPERLHFAADVLPAKPLLTFLAENLPSLRVLRIDGALPKQEEGAI